MAKPKGDGKAVVDERGQLLVHLDGAEYVLRPDWLAIKAIETQLGGLTLLVSRGYAGALTIEELAIIIAECMRGEGRQNPDAGPSYKAPKAESIAPMILEAGAPGITARVVVLLTAASMGGYTAKGEPKPAA